MRRMRPELCGRRHPGHPRSRLRIIYHPDLDQGERNRKLLWQLRLAAGPWRLVAGHLYLLRVARCRLRGESQTNPKSRILSFRIPNSELKILCLLTSVIRQPVPCRLCIRRPIVPFGFSFSGRRRRCTAQTRNSFFQGRMGRKQAHQTASR